METKNNKLLNIIILTCEKKVNKYEVQNITFLESKIQAMQKPGYSPVPFDLLL